MFGFKFQKDKKIAHGQARLVDGQLVGLSR